MDEGKKKYRISIHGCDDSTIFSMELSDIEKELIDKLSQFSHDESSYGCMPILDIAEESHA